MIVDDKKKIQLWK